MLCSGSLSLCHPQQCQSCGLVSVQFLNSCLFCHWPSVDLGKQMRRGERFSLKFPWRTLRASLALDSEISLAGSIALWEPRPWFGKSCCTWLFLVSEAIWESCFLTLLAWNKQKLSIGAAAMEQPQFTGSHVLWLIRLELSKMAHCLHNIIDYCLQENAPCYSDILLGEKNRHIMIILIITWAKDLKLCRVLGYTIARPSAIDLYD